MTKQHEIILCDCGSSEHQLLFKYDDDILSSNNKYQLDDKDIILYNEVYCDIHLTKKPFWKRLKYGIKYIFGYQCRYGAFDEIILDIDDIPKFEKIIEHLNKVKERVEERKKDIKSGKK